MYNNNYLSNMPNGNNNSFNQSNLPVHIPDHMINSQFNQEMQYFGSNDFSNTNANDISFSEILSHLVLQYSKSPFTIVTLSKFFEIIISEQ